MEWILYVVSLIWIAFGSFMILYTNESRNAMKRFYEDVNHKVLAVLPFIAGILLLAAASTVHHSWFIRLIGIMGLLKGVFIFLSPGKTYDELMRWYLELSDQSLRFHGIMGIILGTVILSWIK